MIWLILVVLFLFIGFAMQKLKWYFLISGYNTMTKEQKENVNVKALGKLLAIYSYSLAGLFALIALVDWLDYSQFIMPLLILFIILTVFVVVKSQKYNHNIFDENGKWKKGASKQLKKPTIILAITFIGVAIIMYFSLQPTGIETTEEGIEIAGSKAGCNYCSR